MTLLPAPSLVGILDRLEKKRLIGRLRSVKDRRHVHIIPKQAGPHIAKGRADP
jgi:DNA-binding MarR family transcriptional regulator